MTQPTSGNPSRSFRRSADDGALGPPGEVVFTSSGTEATTSRSRACSGPAGSVDRRRRRIAASPVEHHAVLDLLDWLVVHELADVVRLPVDLRHQMDVGALKGPHRQPGSAGYSPGGTLLARP